MLSSCSMGQSLTTMQAAGLAVLCSTRCMQELVGAGAENPQIRSLRWEGLAWERDDIRRGARYHTAHCVKSACSPGSDPGWCGALVPQQADCCREGPSEVSPADARARVREVRRRQQPMQCSTQQTPAHPSVPVPSAVHACCVHTSSGQRAAQRAAGQVGTAPDGEARHRRNDSMTAKRVICTCSYSQGQENGA